MGEPLKLPPLERDICLEQLELREDKGVTRLSFSASSEIPIERWFGQEILSHDPKAVRLDRAKQGAMPLLFNHEWGDPIGMVDKARISDNRMMVDAHLYDTARAKEVGQMIAGGLKNISIGYRIHVVEEDTKEGTFTARDWEPYEVSVVTVPADPTVGIGRKAQGEALEVRMISNPAASATKGVKMETQPTAAAVPATEGARVIDNGYDPVKAQQERAAQIRKMAQAMDLNDERSIQHWIMSGKNWNEIGDDMIKAKTARTTAAVTQSTGIGLTEGEAKRFSMVKAINAVIYRDWSKAGFEAAVSKAEQQRAGKVLNEFTFAIPAEVENLKRVLISGTATQGGNLVQTDLVSFIDILRNRTVCFQAGVMVMGGLVGAIAIPRKTAGGTGAWVAETGTATANEMTIGQLTMSPKRFAGYQEYSKQLMIQSTPSIESLIFSDLAGEIAVKIDAGILRGTGANNPLGIRFNAIGTANPTAGTAVVYSDMIRFQTTVAGSNAFFEGFTYVTTPTVAGILMGKARFTNSDTPVWNGGILNGTVVGQRAWSSVQVTSGEMLAGDFSTVIFGQWAGVEIEVNPYANFQADIVGVKGTVYGDVGVRYPGAFAVGTGMTG